MVRRSLILILLIARTDSSERWQLRLLTLGRRRERDILPTGSMTGNYLVFFRLMSLLFSRGQRYDMGPEVSACPVSPV